MWRLIEPALRRSLDELDAAVSPRTLQRHLSGEGTTFARDLGSTRQRIALHYLRHTPLSNVEIALLIGYDEPTSFHRAFHGWTGQTPGAARSSGRASVSA